MTLLARYDGLVQAGEIQPSASQRDVVIALDALQSKLQERTWLFKPKRCQGLYVYGPVGVGKTYVLDLFYESLLVRKKARFHFHRFMQQVDAELRRLQGTVNPLVSVAKKMASTCRVLCLDEFLVNDVAHAMILAELIEHLLSFGVILVATANTKPDDLYLDGVHRERFIPAIELIKSHCMVMALNDVEDHRLGKASMPKTYITPHNEEGVRLLEDTFDKLSGTSSNSGLIQIQRREIFYKKKGDVAIWFDFDVICNLPRSSLDYLELAEQFRFIFISGIPQISPEDTTHAILLIHLIDVLYDKKIRLVVSSDVVVDAIYPAGPMRQTFVRTESRLKEMQSYEYWSRAEASQRLLDEVS